MKKNKLSQLIRTAILSFSLVGIAQAMPSGGAALGQYDLNTDEAISQEEIIAMRQAEFDSADLNVDRFLALDEYIALKEAQRLAAIEVLFEKMDIDSDGAVTLEEFTAVFPGSPEIAAVLFDKFSSDDGVLGLEELTALRLSTENATEGLSWAFTALDKDNDGLLSASEYVTPWVSDKPETEEPETEEPEAEEPEAEEPETEEPETEEPETEEPETEDDDVIEEIKARIADLEARLAKMTEKAASFEAELEGASGRTVKRLERHLSRLTRHMAEVQTRLDKLQAAL